MYAVIAGLATVITTSGFDSVVVSRLGREQKIRHLHQVSSQKLMRFVQLNFALLHNAPRSTPKSSET